MKDHYIRGLAGNNSVRFILVNSTQMVENARITHNTSRVSTAALGRVLSATAMMGLLMKGDETVSVQFKGSGPLSNVFAMGWPNGHVKGYVSHPDVHLPANGLGKIDVGGAIGKDGELVVIRDYGLKEPYVGRSKLVSGEVAEDLVHYFAYSEQQPSVIALGVNLNDDNTVRAAGGMIIQTLPEISDEELAILERMVTRMKPMSQMLEQYGSCEAVLDAVLGEMSWVILQTGPVEYACDCSRDRIEKALVSMGSRDLKHLIDTDGKAEVTCHFCNKAYAFNEEELVSLLAFASEKDENE